MSSQEEMMLDLEAIKARCEAAKEHLAFIAVETCLLDGEGEMYAGIRQDIPALIAEVERLRVIIKDLLNALPDSGYEGRGDESWDWCWNELSSEAQDEVKAVRDRAKTAYNR